MGQVGSYPENQAEIRGLWILIEEIMYMTKKVLSNKNRKW